MIDPYNWIDKVKRYFAFSSNELKWLLISIPVMAFIVGFNDGRDTFVFSLWMGNLLICLVAVTIAVLAHETAHRLIGLEQGYKVIFKPFFYGLIAGLVLSVMSYGKIVFLAYSGVMLNMLEKHRLGYFRYQLGYFHLGTVSLMGPVANMLVAILFKTFEFLPPELTSKIVLVNIIFALTNMLPIPGLDGPQVLYTSRWLYFLSYGAMIGISIFMWKGFAWWVVALGAILAALVLWLGFYFLIEKHL
ncbi:hypothetical protein HYY72_05275 [Candidatus Woesearchaeota archaeon]|nr:hypothetical protein [Candidatus Woesearchaeota archaeon]